MTGALLLALLILYVGWRMANKVAGAEVGVAVRALRWLLRTAKGALVGAWTGRRSGVSGKHRKG